MEKTFKRLQDGRVLLEGVYYDQSINKRINVTNPNSGYKIDSIVIGETKYYPTSVAKEKKSK